MSNLATEIKASIAWLYQEPLALTTVGDASQLSYDESLANGTAADEADRIWSDERTVAAASHDDLDLTALVHTVFGSTLTVTLAKVKALLIVNTSTTSGDLLQIDSSVTNGFTGANGGSATSLVEIGADSASLLGSKKDGWSVNGTHKVLRIANPGANPITYALVILGTSV